MKKRLIQTIAFLIMFPLLGSAAGAEASKTLDRQRALQAAMDNTSDFAKAWAKPNMKFSTFGQDIRRYAFLKRCLPERGTIRYLMPDYRQYFDAAGDRLYEAAMQFKAASNVGPLRWVADQLSDAEYQQSMQALTSTETAQYRSISDVGRALTEVLQGELIDIDTGEPNVAYLIEFKETLARTGELDHVASALRAISPAYADTFLSLRTMWPVAPATWEAWTNLGTMLQALSESVEQAYLGNLSPSQRAEVAEYEATPAVAKFAQAMDAARDYQIFSLGRMPKTSFTASARLGEMVVFYPERPDSEIAKQSAKAINTNARTIIETAFVAHRADLCSTELH
ncbi:hypothetical protein [Bordetella sp. N]|uniref:hypothetical protein n=1 Tax=Bordetella sp. N TaxID=1746199 RepID=UPI0012E34A08|nr:hypothetical protein [Bordetella sp. N]